MVVALYMRLACRAPRHFGEISIDEVTCNYVRIVSERVPARMGNAAEECVRGGGVAPGSGAAGWQPP